MTQTEIRAYTVQGMTCDHCAASVTKDVGEIAGVEYVNVELASGSLDVGGREVSDQQVRAAVEEAGYRLAEKH